MAGSWYQAETMRNCVKPLDKSLVRDPRHRSDCLQATARSCKANRTGACPTLRTPPTIYRPVRMKSRIRPYPLSQIQYASIAFSRIISNPDRIYTEFFVFE